jgi:hypothetical protein
MLMKMKKLFTIPLLSVIATLTLVSCLEVGGGGNREEGTLFAVVGYSTEEAVPTIATVSGVFAAPSLLSYDLNKGDCILAHFTLDLDHQPTGASLYHATDVSYIGVDQSYAEIQNNLADVTPIIAAEELLPIQAITPQSYNAFLNGKVFFGFRHIASVKQEIDYRMLVVPDNDSSDGTATAYITGKKRNKPDGSTTTIETFYAFDMLHAITELGKETTIRENFVDYTAYQLTLKIKYCVEMDENDVPKYQDYAYSNGITLSVYK